MKCQCCDQDMVEGATTFKVVKDKTFFVVENVPCFECSTCDHISFSQEAAEKLEQLTSGRAAPQRTMTAWVYNWVDRVDIISRRSSSPYSTGSPIVVSNEPPILNLARR